MLDTNTLAQISQAAPQVQNTLNAWHVVALGAGAYLAHAYHSIKAAGGIKNIFRGLWNGDPAPQPKTPNIQQPTSNNQ